MKKILAIICLVFALYPALAQKINLDSLARVAIAQDSNIKSLVAPNRDSLLNQLPFIKSPALRIRRIYDIILNYGELNPRVVFYYHHKILEMVRKNHDQIGESVILSELGYTVAQSGDDAEGLKIIFNALEIAEKTGNKQAIGIVYDNLGVCYNNDYLKKLYWLKALRFSQDGNDDLFVCYELENLGGLFAQEHKTDAAVYYLSKSFELAVRKNIQQALPGIFGELAALQTTAQNKLKYLHAALQFPFAKIASEEASAALSGIASVYLNEGKIDSGLVYAKKAYKTSMNAAFLNRINPALLLADLYKGHNADSALKYTDIYYLARDSAYNINRIERTQALAFAEQQRQQEIAAQKQAYQTNLRTYLLTAVIVFLVMLAFVFWRNNRQNNRAKIKIQQALNELKTTQTQLIQSEKMASLGELTAGIAHEIQNPLNFVNNFSELNKEMLEELENEIKAGHTEDALALTADLMQNEEKINHHGKRADGIVKGMLQHSKAGSRSKQLTNINALADEYIRLAYHGFTAKDKSFKIEIITHFDEKLPKINVIPQDIAMVLLNLFNNAFYAVNQKAKIADRDYKPTVEVETFLLPLLRGSPPGQGVCELKVTDNGVGIPDAVKDKIMHPFFTTKPTGEGTGLGLSLTYDMVVKGHGGTIQANSIEGVGSEFVIQLPLF